MPYESMSRSKKDLLQSVFTVEMLQDDFKIKELEYKAVE